MQCNRCGTDGAYYGLTLVSCVNEECRNYDRDYAEEMKSEEPSKLKAHLMDKAARLADVRRRLRDSKGGPSSP